MSEAEVTEAYEQPPAATLRAHSVGVAICTRNRPLQLDRALRSLERQTRRADELLVIDNAPDDEAAAELVRVSFPGVRYVREPRPGLNFARNRALRESACDIVLFLDDDAVAHADWTRELTRGFAEWPAVALCTGRVEPLTLETAGQRLFEANGGFGRGEQPVRLPADRSRPLHGRRAPLIAWAVSVGSGNSYGVRRQVALELGGFDEALDLGRALPGGGDHDLLWRMLQARREVLYQPTALAWHEHRAGLDDALDQIAGHQRALVAMLAKSVVTTRGGERWGVAGYLAWRLLKPAVRLVRRAQGRDALPAPFLLRMWWNCWRGLLAYPLARREARSRRSAARA